MCIDADVFFGRIEKENLCENRPWVPTFAKQIFKTHQLVKRVQSLSFHLHSRETWNSETTRPWRVKFKTSVSNDQESRTKAISLSLSRRHLGATPRCCRHWLNFWLVLVGERDRNHMLFRYLTIRKHPFWSAWHACQSFQRNFCCKPQFCSRPSSNVNSDAMTRAAGSFVGNVQVSTGNPLSLTLVACHSMCVPF
jgi:hypothetical protein